MEMPIKIEDLTALGLELPSAERLFDQIKTRFLLLHSTKEIWQSLSQEYISTYPFEVQLFIFNILFPARLTHPETAPAWLPSTASIAQANLTHLMAEQQISQVPLFHQWTTAHYLDFWKIMVEKLQIKFKSPPETIYRLGQEQNRAEWFPGGKLNIADSCFQTSQDTAIYYQDEKKALSKLSFDELNLLSNRIANSLLSSGFLPGDAIGIVMPMTPKSVAIYLGIIKIGGNVVSIADSFSSQEIQARLKIAEAKGVFTQDYIHWEGKKLPLYSKVAAANSNQTILIIEYPSCPVEMKANDLSWKAFLRDDSQFTTFACDPMQTCNVLFSSGTMAYPKAIPWNHTTPIKAASDAFLHLNIQPGDILAWPTNLGWMMGPWLLFAAFINKAAIALYGGTPKERGFGEFIQQAKVTLLGVIPTLVQYWRRTRCMEKLDWKAIKVFSSTGECSNPEDMLYLMSLANYKPIIEYCGGTEIGGAYVSSTVIEANYPSLFSTPAMGIDFIILNEKGQTTDEGEAFLTIPSIGLSSTLLNADHEQIYFAHTPTTENHQKLRRHGDQIKRLPNGYFMLLGRADDAMNLAGIKISAAEIERVLKNVPQIKEVAAISITQQKGPAHLIIYASYAGPLDKQKIQQKMQQRINDFLNPLFKIHEVVWVNELPKTASHKIMRNALREKYLSPQ